MTLALVTVLQPGWLVIWQQWPPGRNTGTQNLKIRDAASLTLCPVAPSEGSMGLLKVFLVHPEKVLGLCWNIYFHIYIYVAIIVKE